ncbi:hypothetical protein ISN76_10965 [Dyella halodurans]|uniref:Uncharacterized protein n=1 Tax=Dyella halodurans TaxID=1920171 RepID=A0ABV9C2P9_9GAMM|nr:hypothetical protein [Dyella halodurans]
MKLQIEGQNLRVRIGEVELATLMAGDALVSRTAFAQAFTLTCTVRLGAGDTASFSGRADTWQIEIPEAAVRDHARRLPTREGLKFILAGTGDADALKLLFDVDVRESVRRRRSS